ncbi:hypothetical protein [Nocardioides sp. J54]|uniref:hypothetical protein n=1 Tax=Nocardioides sp. J54 TaxID=935866 RepID=UPI00048F41FD|nr:hypothetical protein [Nocardioides sp. J54]
MSTPTTDARRVGANRSTPCPAWCKFSEAQHEEYDKGEPWLHGSESNGFFTFWQLDGGPITATLDESVGDNVDLTIDRLRELAQASLRAVEWIEAHQ